MIIRKAEYICSAVRPDQYPTDGWPEIALAGRSNVGKSSLINKFLGRRNLARTGNTPGKTQTLNFYTINDQWFWVDLPGYGYAKASKVDRERWRRMMQTYFSRKKNLKAVVQLVDMRHAPSADDQTMHQWLLNLGLPVLVTATKADKIAKGQWRKQLQHIAQTLNLADWQVILPFSAVTGEGVQDLHQAIEEILHLEV
ncbi:MAG: ribosome biogenesis GTP-binding protein YihA/YsxC [Peptococcaceae bacterium]|nr:ribosome biogenesis GTP-binding protein YihA/YsxC [Peptococcaceae bacterium]